MYKLLLCWRYLRTRWIALASIVSVTLGVATLVVVNSVMDGFTTQMQDRMHGILSDLVVEARSTTGLDQPDWYVKRIRECLGDDVAGITSVVTLPAMMTFTVNGQSHTQQINLIGIDDETYASVSDFSKYLLHPENQKKLDFQLRETGYAEGREALQPAGWEHRRYAEKLKKDLIKQQQQFKTELERYQELQRQIQKKQLANKLPGLAEDPAVKVSLSDTEPIDAAEDTRLSLSAATDSDVQSLLSSPMVQSATSGEGYVFDAEKEQRTGIVLGLGLGSLRGRDAEGKVRDHFYLR
ncbi:MAG: ABC transporter permease, partial [Pirellula sp.]